MSSSSSAASCANSVLDFDPRDADAEAVAQTRRLLGQVLAAQGPAGLARALHVAAPKAASLKHRVSCVTCRSRLDPLITSLASASASSAKALDAEPQTAKAPAATSTDGSSGSTEVAVRHRQDDEDCSEGPLPLTAWLAADAGRGLAPAPRALRDLSSLSSFLAAYGCSTAPGTAGWEELDTDLTSRRASGRSGGVVRCQYHSQHCPGCGLRCGCCKPGLRRKGNLPGAAALGTTTCFPALADAMVLDATLQPEVVAQQEEKDRYVAILIGGTTEAEWRQLGTVDIDNSMCDLFAWLSDRGLCAACVDAVAGVLLEMRSMASGACTCGQCLSKDADKKKHNKAPAPPLPLSWGKPRSSGEPPELLRVQGRLRAICGIYRIQPQTLNGRAVYKKDRSEAYLLYTSLKDWMFSGRADAGGSRCEGWAYVTDPAESPDEVCGVWKVSGQRGWEEDRTLIVSSFEGLSSDLKELSAGLSFEGGGAITTRLCYEDGILSVRSLHEAEVLDEILWAPEEPLPARTKTGGCAHVVTAETAKIELRCWLRWLLRDRLDAQRKRVLAQAQVGAALCHVFACAALQQLEEAAEAPGTKSREKKGRSKKNRFLEDSAEVVEAPIQRLEDSSSPAKDAAVAAVPMSTVCGVTVASSDGSASTRASSEEPPDAQKAQLALGAKKLMEQMGWKPKARGTEELAGAEVAEWREQNPSYRKAVQEEREKRKKQFQKWALEK